MHVYRAMEEVFRVSTLSFNGLLQRYATGKIVVPCPMDVMDDMLEGHTGNTVHLKSKAMGGGCWCSLGKSWKKRY